MRVQGAWPALAAALVVAGCSNVEVSGGIPVVPRSGDGTVIARTAGLPDIDRGKQARIDGRLDEAEANLLPLAQRGYPDAQVLLAQTYSQRDSLAGEAEAERWFRAVLDKRPEAAVGLARVLIRQEDRDKAIEAERLIGEAIARGERDSEAAQLDLWSRFPELDTGGTAAALAERLATSASPQDRLSSIAWYRATIAAGDHGRKLRLLCDGARELDLACSIDTAHMLRFADDRAGLEQHIERTLAYFERNETQAGGGAVLRQELDYAYHAGALARAMVDQPEGTDAASALESFEAATGGSADTELPPDVAEALQAARRESIDPASLSTGGTKALTIYPDLADRVLRWMLKRGKVMSVEAAGVAIGYPYLIRDVDVSALLEKAAAEGFSHANLYLGEMYQFGYRSPIDPQKSEQYLIAALPYRSTLTVARYRLGRLYQRGLLGEPEPQKAVDNLLIAARNGAPAAYTRLAELFMNSHGTRIDRINAYVFARRATDSGRPLILRKRQIARNTGAKKEGGGATTIATEVVSYNVLDRLRKEMSEKEIARAEAIYQAERDLRPVIRQPVTLDVWTRATQ